jgi:hypothetical protein
LLFTFPKVFSLRLFAYTIGNIKFFFHGWFSCNNRKKEEEKKKRRKNAETKAEVIACLIDIRSVKKIRTLNQRGGKIQLWKSGKGRICQFFPFFLRFMAQFLLHVDFV